LASTLKRGKLNTPDGPTRILRARPEPSQLQTTPKGTWNPRQRPNESRAGSHGRTSADRSPPSLSGASHAASAFLLLILLQPDHAHFFSANADKRELPIPRVTGVGDLTKSNPSTQQLSVRIQSRPKTPPHSLTHLLGSRIPEADSLRSAIFRHLIYLPHGALPC